MLCPALQPAVDLGAINDGEEPVAGVFALYLAQFRAKPGGFIVFEETDGDPNGKRVTARRHVIPDLAEQFKPSLRMILTRVADKLDSH